MSAIAQPAYTTADVAGIATRYLATGNGPPVLVLHGWGAKIEAVQPIVAALAATNSVVAVDLPGFGETAPPPEQPWGAADYAGWVRALLDHLRWERAHVVGHSRGGAIAIHLGAHTPERVGRLLLVDSAGIRPKRTLRYHRRVAMAKVGKHAARNLGAPGRRIREALVGRAASTDYANAGVMRPTLVKLVNEDLTELMPRVRAPTLLVWGAEDDATPVADGRRMEELIPDAGLVVFDGAGHFAYLDDQHRFGVIAREFLAKP
jgi:pimeloyl-ACP methyl ester carboxylesterase